MACNFLLTWYYTYSLLYYSRNSLSETCLGKSIEWIAFFLFLSSLELGHMKPTPKMSNHLLQSTLHPKWNGYSYYSDYYSLISTSHKKNEYKCQYYIITESFRVITAQLIKLVLQGFKDKCHVFNDWNRVCKTYKL
jgi:hypothetical protein